MSKSKADAILRHAFKLQSLFPATKDMGPVTLYKALHRIEAEAHSFAERCCNEDVPEDKQARKDASILKRLDGLLGFKAAGIPIMLNGDPRGYALKIDDEIVKAKKLDIYTDMGGYGIICPEF